PVVRYGLSDQVGDRALRRRQIVEAHTVIAVAAVIEIDAAAAIHVIVAALAEDLVVAERPQTGRAAVAPQLIVSLPAVEDVVAAKTQNDVDPARAKQEVEVVVADKRVVEFAAVDVFDAGDDRRIAEAVVEDHPGAEFDVHAMVGEHDLRQA